MRGVVPWTSLDEAIAVLTERRDLSSRQIEALKLQTDEREVLIVLQYVALASMLRVADWANAQGWRMRGSSGNPRPYVQDDIRALIQDPPAGVNADLQALAHEIFALNSKAVKKQFW